MLDMPVLAMYIPFMTSPITLKTHRATYDDAVGKYLWLQAAATVQLFGHEMTGSLADVVSADGDEPHPALLACPAWEEFNDLYEYGVQGCEPPTGEPLGGDFYDVLQTPGAYEQLDEILQQVYFLANARRVLDGGRRELALEDIPDGYLSVSEVAALAGMDQRSVRNAMNPKVVDPLVGEQHGSRTFVPISEARRWLAGRRGFVPTSRRAEPSTHQKAHLELPQPLVGRLVTQAAKRGLSVEALLATYVNESERS